MSTVVHLLSLADWEQFGPADAVTNPSLEREGFIHCTDDPAVLIQIANAFYCAADGAFVVLHVDSDRLTSRCVWEEPAHVDGSAGPSFAPTFPHIYGPIDRDAIVAVQPLQRDEAGRFTGYGEIEPVA